MSLVSHVNACRAALRQAGHPSESLTVKAGVTIEYFVVPMSEWLKLPVVADHITFPDLPAPHPGTVLTVDDVMLLGVPGNIESETGRKLAVLTEYRLLMRELGVFQAITSEVFAAKEAMTAGDLIVHLRVRMDNAAAMASEAVRLKRSPQIVEQTMFIHRTWFEFYSLLCRQ